MRIIAGSKKGMTLLGPKTPGTRPITDRVKESLFSVLLRYDLPADAVVADIFCGTGSLGLEALSRGAKHAAFIENNPKVIEILKKNITRAGFDKNSSVTKANAYKTAALSRENTAPYNLVFVDPPYVQTTDISDNSKLAALFQLLSSQVTDNAIVTVRTHKRIQLLESYGCFNILQRRVWGTMAVAIFSKSENPNSHPAKPEQEND